MTRHTTWLCEACRGWRRTVSRGEGPCVVCQNHRHLNGEGLCRLCRRQAALVRTTRRNTAADEANKHGQQLFIVGTFRQRRHRPTPRATRAILPPGYPVTHRQLVLMNPEWDFKRGSTSPAEPRDQVLATALLEAAEEHATRYGWSRTRKVEARTAIRILLGLQDTPGAPIKASDIMNLARAGIAGQPVIDILKRIGMLEEDREPSVTRWFHEKVAALPEPMASELHIWMTVMRDGSDTPPRRRLRSPVTIRFQLNHALPALTKWADEGHTSLREIARADVLAALPDGGTPRSAVGQGLRSIFTILKGRKVIFTNPTARIRTGRPEERQPLPLGEADGLAAVREALSSPDPARAAMTALVAFHALRNHHLRNLMLVDVDRVRLNLDNRTVVLANPVRKLLTQWLNYRATRWPKTLNPYVFVNPYTAVRTCKVSSPYINQTVGMRVQDIREDRILHEAQATGGDVRRLCDLFGLSIPGAQRYTDTIEHPDLKQET
ncbi:hypothetical protein AB0I84_46095 [Streptomyces spectabilis]|uniref:hypothetical protein n=1 Tax=Streptomyces spectabilis TaxID=68270 RepID=UPI0033FDD12A